EEAHPYRAEAELITESELVGQRDHALVGGDDHVVEAVDPVSPEVHRTRQPPGGGRALEERYVGPGLGQAQRQNGAEDAGADDSDARPLAHSSRASGEIGGGWIRPIR